MLLPAAARLHLMALSDARNVWSPHGSDRGLGIEVRGPPSPIMPLAADLMPGSRGLCTSAPVVFGGRPSARSRETGGPTDLPPTRLRHRLTRIGSV